VIFCTPRTDFQCSNGDVDFFTISFSNDWKVQSLVKQRRGSNYHCHFIS